MVKNRQHREFSIQSQQYLGAFSPAGAVGRPCTYQTVGYIFFKSDDHRNICNNHKLESIHCPLPDERTNYDTGIQCNTT